MFAGLLSSEILRLVDWAGYFLCLSSLCLLVVIATAVFPNKNIKIQSLKEYQRERAAKVAAEKAALEAAAAAAGGNPGSRRNSKLRDMLNGLHLKSKTDSGSSAREP